MNVEKNVSVLRFEGFSDEWVEKPLNHEVELFSGLTYSPKDIRKEGVFVIRSSNVKNGQIVQADNVYVNPEVVNCSNVKKGDIIVVVRNGSRALIGKHAQVNSLMDNTVIGAFMTGVRASYPEFINALFDTDKFKAQVEKNLGATINQITNGAFNSMVFMFPEGQEKTAIGNTFQKLDNLINQHQQKHDKLSNIKKAMLEKMFPKQGETIPEIRFKGFSGEWAEKELGELAEIVRGASPRPIEDPKWFDKSSTVGWLRIRDVTEQDGRIYVLEQRISKLGQEKTRVLFEPHLLLSIAASVGKPVINYVETGVHDGFLIFKKPLFELEFMYQWLKSFQEAWQQYGQPGSQVNLNSDIVKGQVVCIPSNAEQLAIGNYLQKLDALINQHQQQIIKLTNIKQACLNKMFV